MQPVKPLFIIGQIVPDPPFSILTHYQYLPQLIFIEGKVTGGVNRSRVLARLSAAMPAARKPA